MRHKFLIKGLDGKKTLNGVIQVRGSKNAVLPAMAASVLFSDSVSYSNVPEIEDVSRMGELLSDLGVSVSKSAGKLVLDSAGVDSFDFNAEISKRLRASIILMGPMLARFGKVSFPHPGGCVIGARPIDIFLEGFEKMGAKVEHSENRYNLTVPNGKLKGMDFFFKIQSVTATEAFLMAACLAEGKTVLKNVALEPEITSLAEYLSDCGAKISGIGTSTLEIEGGGLLKSGGKIFEVIPDRVEAGCFLILGALAADNLKITNCNPSHLEILTEILKASGVPIEIGKDSITIKNNGKIKNDSFLATNIRTHEYPGFPTDIQAPMVVFLTQAKGESLVFETIFEGRLNYTQDIVRMGGNVTMFDPHRVLVKGPTALKGRELEGPDIRAGLAFVIAAIIAKGRSVISNVYYIDRGYERIEERLSAIGVDIVRELVTEEAIVVEAEAAGFKASNTKI